MDVSFSEMWAFKNCRTRWDLSYNQRIVPKIDAIPLSTGRFYHEALEDLYRHKALGNYLMKEVFISEALKRYDKYVNSLTEKYPNLEEQIEQVQFQTNLLTAMLTGYYHFAERNDKFTIPIINEKPAVELKFNVPIITPTGNPSSKFKFVGKIDGIIKYLGKYWVHEIKTSKMWSDSNVELLPIDPQCLGYMYAAQQYLGIKISGAIYSVTMKSSLRQKKNESIEEFRSRLVKDYKDRPDFYYRRNFIYANQNDIQDFGYSIWDISKDMSPNPRIYKSVGASTCGFGCQYRKLCTATDPQDKENILKLEYREKEAKHEELQN